ncbi:hypothetical protein [Mucilaginibacter sp. OK268]|uniref:hypothetical protein n=1 Tax=Mucilaginibacter sp. OK268 TaxID=1881048 RepID=UPI00115FBB20|nr:hypothetical protein [Mucilaginibacter sp. OK268]
MRENNFILTRRVDKPIHDIYDQEMDLLRSSTFNNSDVPGMSLNMLGGKFIPEYNKFKTKAKGSEYWTSQYVWLCEYIKDYEIIEHSFTNIYFQSEDLHKLDIPFTREINRDSKRLYVSLNIDPTTVGDKYKDNGQLFLKHCPTNLNYWHAEIALTDIDEKELNRNKLNNSQKTATTYVIDHILSVCCSISETQNINQIEVTHYKFN